MEETSAKLFGSCSFHALAEDFFHASPFIVFFHVFLSGSGFVFCECVSFTFSETLFFNVHVCTAWAMQPQDKEQPYLPMDSVIYAMKQKAMLQELFSMWCICLWIYQHSSCCWLVHATNCGTGSEA